MAPVLALLIVIAAWDCVRSALRYSAQDYRRSRGKAAEKAGKADPGSRWKSGYWAREALHLFPVARAGWQSGWLAHKTARDHHRARREEARTLHLQTRASVLRGFRDHRLQQAEAQAEIDQALAEASTLNPRAVRSVADELARKRAEKELHQAQVPAAAPPLPADAVKPAPGPHAESSRPAPQEPAEAPVPEQPQPPPATGGTTMAADTTYDQLMDETRRLIDQEENHLAEVQKSRLQSLLESLAGVLTDPRNLGRAADLDEAQRTYAKEIQKFLDQLQSFRDGLQRDHGGMHDAHQDAPVSGAQPGFYEG